MPSSAAVAFGATDWLVVFGVLFLTTLLGTLLGKGATIRDFFLGGRRLPWWSVSASIIATEISAVTLVSVPFLVFKPGGNFAYLQIVLIGSVLARLAVAWWLVPAYYEREIYSPYDFIGARLGTRAKNLATLLFSVGGVLSQASRVYLTALVLEIVLAGPLARVSEATHLPTLALSIALLTVFAVAWTWIGGMAAVVWTDFVLFFVFTASAIVLLFVISARLDLGLERIWLVGVDAHKADLFDFDTRPAKAFTFWTAAIASSWGGIASYGVDQLMAQRLFCCRGVADARKAIVWSSVGVVVPVLVAFVGVGLFAYYERHPMSESARALFARKGENLLMIFTTDVVPSGWKGLVVAGILAAAISSLDGILTALSQTTLSSVFAPLRRRALSRMTPASRPGAEAEERRSIRTARLLVLGFGAGLGALAFAMDELSQHFGSILELALTMATFTQGALLAGFALALLAPRVGGSGFLWSAPYSVLFVYALAWHDERSRLICQYASIAFVLAWFFRRTIGDLKSGEPVKRSLGQLLLVVIAACVLCWLQRHGQFASERNEHADQEWVFSALAFPWYVPVASTLAFALGLFWARDDEPAEAPEYA
jgi:Na+/proline symporter